MNLPLTLASSCFSLVLFSTSAYSATTVSFQGQGGYDGFSTVGVGLFDPVSSVNFTMTVSSTGSGGNLNSNSTGLGVGSGDANLNVGEEISISFNVDTEINLLDLGGVGAGVSDGITIQFGSSPSFDLYTGQANFAGVSDLWTPSSAVALSAGELLTFRVSHADAIVDLDGMNVSAVPEPSSSLLLGFGGLVGLCRRKRGAS